MDEKRTLRRLSGGDAGALEAVIGAYSPYVCAIARNIIQPPLQPEDVEEIASDVFLRLWEHAAEVKPGKLRAWLAAVTRNSARDRLRAMRLAEPLDDDCLLLSIPGPEDGIVRLELRELTRRAVDALPEPDRSIFKRHYYLYQKTDEIALELSLNASTVRTKLARGREKLRQTLIEGGYSIEVDCG